MRLLNDACALMTNQWEKTQGWQSMLVPEIARRLGDSPQPGHDLRARALTASAIACLNAAIDAWMATAGATPLPALLDRAMGTPDPVAATDDDLGGAGGRVPPGELAERDACAGVEGVGQHAGHQAEFGRGGGARRGRCR